MDEIVFQLIKDERLIHTHSQTYAQFRLRLMYRTVGPTWTQEQHANSTQRGLNLLDMCLHLFVAMSSDFSWNISDDQRPSSDCPILFCLNKQKKRSLTYLFTDSQGFPGRRKRKGNWPTLTYSTTPSRLSPLLTSSTPTRPSPDSMTWWSSTPSTTWRWVLPPARSNAWKRITEQETIKGLSCSSHRD